MEPNLTELKKAHYALMDKYIDVLNQTSKLPLFVPGQPSPPRSTIKSRPNNILSKMSKRLKEKMDGRSFVWPNLLSLRFLVRLFVESHIKGKLSELSVAYAYLAQKVREDKKYVTWLKEKSEECDKLAATLTSLQSVRGIVTALLPVGIGIVTAWKGVDTIYQALNQIQITLADLLTAAMYITVYPLLYISIFVNSAFQSKRGLFMPGFDNYGKPIDANHPAETNNIVYYLEDQVFQLIGRGKVREPLVDMISGVSIFITISILMILILVYFSSEFSPVTRLIYWLIAGSTFIFWTGLLVIEIKRRKWR